LLKDIKKIVVIGGTGTLGQAIVKEALEHYDKAHVVVVSRDEHKQALMSKRFPTVEFVIGDVRDSESFAEHLAFADIVYHVAALKHVDIIEKNVNEAVLTNYHGTVNVAKSCIDYNVPYMVFSSTDKAIDPINAYGYSKALAEKYIYSLNSTKKYFTKFSVFRWGNVLGSQGSAIPYFIKTLKNEQRVYLTSEQMTRYWIPIEWAVQYMFIAYDRASSTQAMIPPNMKTAKVTDIVSALAKLLEVPVYKKIITGLRPGEKMHESMISIHSNEHYEDSNTGARYSEEELEQMLLPIVMKELGE
jgi:UDP-N-acetylglucosamine 4,6-dehydratase/5-epimerase